MNWGMFDKRIAGNIPGTPAYMQKKEEERREEQQQKNQNKMINNQLQPLISRLAHHLSQNEEFQGLVQKMNRHLVQSSILNMRYANNFESLDVAVHSMKFILDAMELLENEKDQQRIRAELGRPKQDLARINRQKYQEVIQYENQKKQS